MGRGPTFFFSPCFSYRNLVEWLDSRPQLYLKMTCFKLLPSSKPQHMVAKQIARLWFLPLKMLCSEHLWLYPEKSQWASFSHVREDCKVSEAFRELVNRGRSAREAKRASGRTAHFRIHVWDQEFTAWCKRAGNKAGRTTTLPCSTHFHCQVPRAPPWDKRPVRARDSTGKMG